MTGEFVFQEVERTARVFAEAREALRMACVRAVARGADQDEVAEKAGVELDTVQAWVADQGRSQEQVRSDDDPPTPDPPAPQRRTSGWIDIMGASA